MLSPSIYVSGKSLSRYEGSGRENSCCRKDDTELKPTPVARLETARRPGHVVIEAAVSEHKHARPGLHRINFSRYFSSGNINQSASSTLLNTTTPPRQPRSYRGDRQCAAAAPTPCGPARRGVASQAAERREADHCRLSGVSHPVPHSTSHRHPRSLPPQHPITSFHSSPQHYTLISD